MSPEEKAKFWMEVYVAAVRAFEVGVGIGGHGTHVNQVTKYATECADKALVALNSRLEKSGSFD